MTGYLIATILLILAVGGVICRKVYFQLPITELRRRARRGDALASKLYTARAYGESLAFVFWTWILVSSAIGFVILSREANIWLSLVVVCGVLWISFTWLPYSHVSRLSTKLTVSIAPSIDCILNYLQPIRLKGSGLLKYRRHKTQHTGLFERKDLLRLIESQKSQPDSRFSDEELDIATRALKFDEITVADLVTSRDSIKTLTTEDTLGPILIDELHKNGQEFALVLDAPKGSVVGSLEFSKLSLNSKGKVGDEMDPCVYYIHEQDTLSQALHAFFVTNHSMFVVTNNFEELVGIITIEDILKRLIGHVPGEEFDQYSNLEAVAHRHIKLKKSSDDDETVTEVIK